MYVLKSVNIYQHNNQNWYIYIYHGVTEHPCWTRVISLKLEGYVQGTP